MNTDTIKNSTNKLFTIPNLLSFLRLCLIPFIVWQYCFTKNYFVSALLLLLSGITDIADGFIARRLQMITDFGKAFDPIADKLTQLAVMICLITRFSSMLLPFFMLLIKETIAGIIGFITIRQTQIVPSAKWHGKLCTVTLYAVLFLHIIWYSIPQELSGCLILCSVLLMLLSALLYTVSGIQRLIHHKSSYK